MTLMTSVVLLDEISSWSGVNDMPEQQPKISIVSPSYNQGRFIETCIKSVLQQEFTSFEHIVVDGGSTDETLEILGKYDHVKWISEPDQGMQDALNKGFHMATGDIIGWLNTDDYYLPGCFAKVANYFLDHPETDVLYGDYRWVDQDGRVTQLRREIDFDMFILKYLHVLYIPSTATFIHKRAVSGRALFNPDYSYAMDYELFLRLALEGYKFSHIHAFLADFRFHEKSKTTTGAHLQRREQKRALLTHDPFLKQWPRGVQKLLLPALTFVARTKRTIIKALRGYYSTQWYPRVSRDG